jgi:hypothetical protein
MVNMCVRPWNDMGSDNFADSTSSCRAGIDRASYRCDLAPYDCGDQTCVDFLVSNQLDVGSLDHRVSRFNHRDQASAFNHT